MAKLLQIAQAGNRILRQRAEKVENIKHNGELLRLINDMIYTCQDADGVGIAAPQVYVPWRVIVVASKPSARYPQAPQMEPLAMINPVIVVPKPALVDGWEGCLSMPGLRAIVPRHKEIHISFLDLSGTRISGVYQDFVARVIQHEVDHLDGKMFFDCADPRSFTSESEFQRLVRNGGLEEAIAKMAK